MASRFEKEIKERMNKTISVYQEEIQTIRAGRANPMILNKVTVSYYGTDTPLKQVANISAPEPNSLLVQPFDPTMVKEIEKAILTSDLGLNPSNDGKNIFIPIPQLTEERRIELTKLLKKEAEDAKVSIRNIRRDINDKIKKLEKDKEISEDEKKEEEADVQKLTDEFIEEIDKITNDKEKELMEI